jgi:hypothetical protein
MDNVAPQHRRQTYTASSASYNTAQPPSPAPTKPQASKSGSAVSIQSPKTCKHRTLWGLALPRVRPNAARTPPAQSRDSVSVLTLPLGEPKISLTVGPMQTERTGFKPSRKLRPSLLEILSRLSLTYMTSANKPHTNLINLEPTISGC